MSKVTGESLLPHPNNKIILNIFPEIHTHYYYFYCLIFVKTHYLGHNSV
jgi:hypothetical protein